MKISQFKTFKKILISPVVVMILFVPRFADTVQGIYTFDESIYTDGTVRVVRIYDSILYIGGDFSKVYDQKGSYSRKGIAAINLSTRLVTEFKADINSGSVRALFLCNKMLYAGGVFAKVNSIPRSNVVALNPETGNVIETFSNKESKINGIVLAVACLDKKLYVGGNFTNVNGTERNYLVALDAETGAVDISINPSPCDSMDYDGKMDGGVFALEAYKNDSLIPGILFVGGNYQTICGVNGKQFLVALNSNGTLGLDFDKRISQAVDALECKDSVLYVGYAGFGNRPAAYKITDRRCVELWKGYTVNGDVQAVTCSEKNYLFFSFHQGLYDTTDQYRCAVLDAITGKPYDVLPAMSSFFGIYSLDSYKEIMAAGGTFRRIGEKKQNYLAIFNMPVYPLQNVPSKVFLKVPINDSIINSRNVTLKWHFASLTESFEIQISSDSLFSNLLETYSSVTNYEKRYSDLETATRYFWRVRGLNQWGFGEWSDYSSFVTAPGSKEIPEIIIPADNADSVETNFTCIWNSEVKAQSYRLQVSSQNSFDSLVLDTIVESDTSVMISHLSNHTKYFLRVQAVTHGGLSDWKIIEFTTKIKRLSSPVAVFPEDEMNNLPLMTYLKWRSDKEAVKFNLQVFTDSTLNIITFDIKNIQDTFYKLNKLEPGTRYYWRLQSSNASVQSEWSRIWKFNTTAGSNTIPEIISPEKNALNLQLPVVCKWYHVSDATGYSIQVSNDKDFKDCIKDFSNMGDTSFVLNELENEVTYYLRVRTVIPGGFSEWVHGNFKTIKKIPKNPLLLKPLDKIDQVELNPLCLWSYDENTRVYNIQLSTEGTFSSLLIDSTVSDTSVRLHNLKSETEYFIRIRAINEAGQVWSEHATFTTMYSLPAKPALLYPCSSVNVLSDTVQFLWNSSEPYVDQYRIEIAYDSLMEEMILSTTTKDTIFLLKGCRDHSSIFWKVQAINRTGAGMFSPTGVFTTDFSKINRVVLHKILITENLKAISYTLGKESNIRIELFNLRGTCVWEFKKNYEFPASYLKIIEIQLQPGKYILRFKAGSYLENREVMFIQ